MFVHIAVIYVRCNISKQLAADLIGFTVKNDNVYCHFVFKKETADGVNCNLESLILRIAENAGGDQGECNRFAAVFLRQHERSLIAGDQQFTFTMLSIVPARTDSVDNIFAGQLVALCDFCVPGFAAVERFTCCQQLRSCSTMNTAVHTAATQQRLVGSVDDGINLHFRNVVSHNLERHNFHILLISV